MVRERSRAWTVAATVAVAAMVGGCDGARSAAGGCPCDPVEVAPPVDTALMAYLSKVRVVHHEVDLLEQEDRLAEAIAKLQDLASAVAPGGGTLPEVQEVLADTLARLADLQSRAGRYDDAARSIEDGLKRAPAGSYFEGHLYEVRGVSEQRRADSLATRGNVAAARVARDAAMKAFERAVEIQDQVISRALQGDGGVDAR